MLWVFALAAVLLSAIGVLGVTSYAVAQRTREFAIRLALGAPARSVFGMVTRECLATAMAGIAIGVAGALTIGRLLTRFLHGVVATDISTLLLSTSTILIIVFAACQLPAWRATRVEPMTALRCD